MKTRLTRAFLTLSLILFALPIMSQDWMVVHFKNGTTRKFYLENVTEIVASKNDSEGSTHSNYLYQHITTLYNKYVYAIEDIDSISFTKYNEDVVIQNIASATDAIEIAIQNCNTIDDIKPKLDEINKIDGIEKAWIGGNQLFVKIKGWEKIAYVFSGEDTIIDEEDFINEARSIVPRYKSSSNNTKLRAVIANQQYRDEAKEKSFRKKYEDLVSDFDKCGIEALILDGPDIQFFRSNSDDLEKRRNMYDYDIVFVRTHGGSDPVTDENGNKDETATTHSIVSSEDLGIQGNVLWRDAISSLRSLRPEDCSDDHIYLSGNHETRNKEQVVVYHPGLSELFFSEIADGKFQNPNSLLFMGACATLEDNFNFAKLFVGEGNKNLGSYWGYDKSEARAGYAGIDFLSGILKGKSQYLSYTDLESKYKTETGVEGANLLRWPSIEENTQMYIIPTITKETDPETAYITFKASNLVEVTGYATSLKPEDLSMGFTYGTDEEEVSYGTIPAVDVVPLMKPIEKGNVLFRAYITDIKPEVTYYYRAFTYDGEHYNYGEPCSFKIENQDEPDEPDEPVDPDEPDEPISDKELMLSEKVNGVDYKIYKKIIDETDYHENPDGWKCYKSELSLETTANGNTQTIVLDNKIYLDDSRGHHGGQFPCMLIDYKNDRLVIFCNSKDAEYQYSMEGYSYVSSLNNLNFSKEIVFTRANWGWYPFFVENSNGSPTLSHFSYAGYYAMESTRNNNGSWDTAKKSKIKPDEFAALSKQAGQVLVIGDNSGDDNPPSGDDTPTTSCPAKITNVELINAGYSRNEDYPNRLYFSASATLDDLTGVEEWGVYFDYSAIIELPFESVDREMSKTIAYTFKGDSRDDDDLKFDINSYVAEWTDAIGVYVKKRDTSSGELTTIYGDKYQFKLRYDTPPSMVLSDPVVVGTEKKGEKYYTTITYKYNLKGAIWVDYVDSAVSGGNWSFDGFDETWYPEYDGPGESEWLSTYTDNTSDLSHTNWRRLHLRNDEVVNSNYVNLTGTNTITEAWVTDSPVYSRTRSGSGGEKGMIRNIIHANPAPAVRKIASYKRGTLGEVMK